MEYKKMLHSITKWLWIFGMGIILCVILIYYGFKLENELENKELVEYSELVYSEEKENEHVKFTTTYLPYDFAEKTDDSYTYTYYLITDTKNIVYIARLTDSTVSSMRTLYEIDPENYSYELSGYTHEIPDDLKQIAIESYNEVAEKEIVNNENFKDYLGSTYMDEINAPVSDLYIGMFCFGIGGGIVLFVLLIYIIVVLIRFKSKVNKFGQGDLEMHLSSPMTLNYSKSEVYLTNDYIISTAKGIDFYIYEDLAWMYLHKQYYNGILTHMYLLGFSKYKNKKQILAYSRKDENSLNEIVTKILEKNPNILIGFNKENKQKYKEIIKSNKIK